MTEIDMYSLAEERANEFYPFAYSANGLPVMEVNKVQMAHRGHFLTGYKQAIRDILKLYEKTPKSL